MKFPNDLYLEAAEASYILSLGHAIPVCNGWATQYVEINYPGFSWNTLSSAIRKAAGFTHAGKVEQLCTGLLFLKNGEVILDDGSMVHEAKANMKKPIAVDFS